MKNYTINSRGELFFLSTVEKIEEKSFSHVLEIKKIFIPSGVKEITPKAFYDCENLEEVVFPKDSKCEKIGQEAFCRCHNLKKINFPESLKIICRGAFALCYKLVKIELREKIEIVQPDSFMGCCSLQLITILNPKATIEDQAFRMCKAITNLRIGNRTWGCLVRGPGIVLLKSRKHFQGNLLILGTVFFGYDGKKQKINGEKMYLCLGDSGFVGEGYDIKSTYSDYIFLSHREDYLDKLHDFGERGEMTFEHYRIISGSCFMASWLVYVNSPTIAKERALISDVLEVVKTIRGDRHVDLFVRFCKEKMTIDQLREEIIRERKEMEANMKDPSKRGRLR